MEQLYTLKQVAKMHSGLTLKGVQNWVASGLLKPTDKLGGRNLFSERAIIECRLLLNARGRELSEKRAAAMRARHAERRRQAQEVAT